MKVLVLGAGVVGVSTAYYLARAGHAVTVVDRQPGPGLETSRANGGQISANHTEPWANPSTPRKALKWLGRADAPLLLRPRLDPALWSWLVRFVRNCTPARARLNTERAMRIALYSRQCLGQLRDETGIEYDGLQRGILHIFRDGREFKHARTQAEFMTTLGCERRIIDAAACVALESALAAAEPSLVGGIYSPDDESGDAYLFTGALADLCTQQGVEFRFETTIKGLTSDGQQVNGIKTNKGDLSADAVVLSLGSYSPLLLRPLGITLPVYPAKGYSVTLPVENPRKTPAISLIDDEHKLVFSRLGNRLRVAGTAELAGYDPTINEARARHILDLALELFPGCSDPDKAEFWAGLRPKTPDSAPVIGPTSYKNLFLNTGHGTLGWTMACGSGKLIADLISKKQPAVDLSGLGIDRF